MTKARPASSIYMERPPRCRCSLRPSAWVVGILSVILLSLSLLAVIHDLATFVRPVEPASSCAIRREWRTLHATEKLEYIRAVQCLKQQPSRLGYAHTLYDDFPYVHIHTGNSCRYSMRTPSSRREGGQRRHPPSSLTTRLFSTSHRHVPRLAPLPGSSV